MTLWGWGVVIPSTCVLVSERNDPALCVFLVTPGFCVPECGRFCGVEIVLTHIGLFDTIILYTDIYVTWFSVLECVCERDGVSTDPWADGHACCAPSLCIILVTPLLCSM